ncbi:MAG: hypothetical protein JNL69_00410 [Bacteroidia bacterium]|nr:hypothetical protein [Bacteroidia bacterium]
MTISSIFTILGWGFLVIFFMVVLFFILMAEKVIKRTETTIKIERFLETMIGSSFNIILHGLGRLVSKQIENSRLKFICKYCGYADDVQREFRINCSKDASGISYEDKFPFKCRHCHKRFDKAFKYCPSCKKSNSGLVNDYF